MPDNIDHVQCGYIKAKFPITWGKTLKEHDCYTWVHEIARPRITPNFFYIAIGHDSIRDNGHAREILHRVSELDGKVTRLDFFVDYLGLLDFDVYYDFMDNGTRPKPREVRSPDGKSVYVGKRSSARMLRVYNKRAEVLAKKRVDIGFDITRIELEVKRDMVSQYRALFMSGNTLAILADIQKKYSLRGFCNSHETAKPLPAADKATSCFAFVQRFRRVISEAYNSDRSQFLDIIGEK